MHTCNTFWALRRPEGSKASVLSFLLFLPGRRVWSLEPWLTRMSCLVLYPSLQGIDIDRGEARSGPSGKAEINPYLLGETNPIPLGSGEAESIP